MENLVVVNKKKPFDSQAQRTSRPQVRLWNNTQHHLPTPPSCTEMNESSVDQLRMQKNPNIWRNRLHPQMSTVFQASVRQQAHFVRTDDLHKPSFHHDGFLTTGAFMHKETRLKQKEPLLSQF